MSNNPGQGGGFSWGEALNVALPIAGLAAGMYARPGTGQDIATFAALMQRQQENEQKRKEEQAAQAAIAQQLGTLGFKTDPSMPAATQLGFANVQSAHQKQKREEAERQSAQQANTVLASLRRPDRPLEERERILEEHERQYGMLPSLEPAFTRLRTQFAEERKRGVKAKEFGEGFMRTRDVPLAPEPPKPELFGVDLGMLPPPPTTRVREIPESYRGGVTRAQDYIRETGEVPTAAAQMTQYGLPEEAVVGGPEAAADRRRKIAEAKKAETDVTRRTVFTDTTLPKLESSLETLAKTKGLDPQDIEAVRAVLDVAKDDPSHQNVRAAANAIQALPKMVTQRKQFGERMAIEYRRLDELEARANKAVQSGNLKDAEQNVRFMIQRIDAEIAKLKDEAEFADDMTKRRNGTEVERLRLRRGELFGWLEDVTGQRAETPGTGLPEPVKVPPPGQGKPANSGGTIPSKYLKKPGG